jgi:polysaccharide biosynthesis protein PslH
MKVLFVLSRFPYPLEKGDKLRAFQQIINMHDAGFKVHLVAVSDCVVEKSHIRKLEPYCESIRFKQMNRLQIAFNLIMSFIRNLPLQVGYFYSAGNKRFIHRAISDVQPDVIYCQLIRTALFVKDLTDIPKVIDYQDAFVKGTKQRLADAPFILRPLFRREIKLVEAFEKNTFEWFRKHFIISKQDRDELSFTDRDKVVILPNGIDTAFFHPVEGSKDFDVTFVGNMNYPPNIDAAVFLINEVMPIVWKLFPSAKVQLAGANPANAVKRLESKLVTITGWVDDIRTCYSRTKIFAAPMRIGTGLQNKLLEAMSMNIPAVTTPISFEPLGAKAGTDILVGANAGELATHIINLLSNSDRAAEIAGNGNAFVKRTFSMEFSRQVLSNEMKKLVPAL